MDITGARWSADGAEAVLKLRAVHTNDDFEAPLLHRITGFSPDFAEALPPQGGSEGPYLHLSHSTASKNSAYIIELPSTFVAHLEFCVRTPASRARAEEARA